MKIYRVHTPGIFTFYIRNLWLYARFKKIRYNCGIFVDMIPQQVRFNFVMSADKLPGSLFIGVFVCVRMILHFHIMKRFGRMLAVTFWHVLVELLISRTQRMKLSKRFIFSWLLTFRLFVMAVLP